MRPNQNVVYVPDGEFWFPPGQAPQTWVASTGAHGLQLKFSTLREAVAHPQEQQVVVELGQLEVDVQPVQTNIDLQPWLAQAPQLLRISFWEDGKRLGECCLHRLAYHFVVGLNGRGRCSFVVGGPAAGVPVEVNGRLRWSDEQGWFEMAGARELRVGPTGLPWRL